MPMLISPTCALMSRCCEVLNEAGVVFLSLFCESRGGASAELRGFLMTAQSLEWLVRLAEMIHSLPDSLANNILWFRQALFGSVHR